MRKLFIVLICLLYYSSGASQTYRVNFYQNTPVYISNSSSVSEKEIVNSYIDDDGSIFYIGNYVSSGNSFIKKFNTRGEEIFSYDFAQKVFISYEFPEYAVATGKLVKTPLNRFLLVCQKSQDNARCQRVICFDSTFQTIWDVTAPANPQGVSYMIKDISFDESNNIYLLSDVGYNAPINGYTNVYLYKYSSDGNIIWQKTINTSPFEMTYNKIVKMKPNSFVIAITRATYYKNSFTLYEIDKSTGNTLKYNLYSDNPSYIFKFDCKELNGSYYLSYTTDSMPDYHPHSFLRKYNSNLDSVWSIRDGSLSTMYSLQTDNAGHIVCLGNPYAIAYDTNGVQWWKTNTFPSISSYKTSEGFALTRSEQTMPAFTNIEFNGGILANSEIYNPANITVSPHHLYPNPQNNLQFISIGELKESLSPSYLFFNNYEKTGKQIYSATEKSINEIATDLKYFNSNIFISGASINKVNDVSGFINKYNYSGALQWSSNLYSNEKSIKINKICPSSQEIFACGEIFDTLDNKNHAFVSGMNNDGAVTFKYSFKSVLPNEGSAKIVTSYYAGGNVFTAGQYKDSLGRSKVFIAKNIGTENIWLKKINTAQSTNDSLVSFFIDQFYNCCVSYNSYDAGISKKYTVQRFNNSGDIIFNSSKENQSGIILKKTIFDGVNSIYNLSSSKGANNFDLLTEKLDTTGVIIWTDTYSTNVNYNACDITSDLNANIVVTANFVNSSNKTDAFTMKLSKNGERMWSKVYNSQNKFEVKKISVDDVFCCYLSGISYDAAGNKTQMVLEYDKEGNQRFFINYNERNSTNLLSFSDEYYDNIITNVEGGQKKMFTLSNVNRLNNGSDVKLNIFNAFIVPVIENNNLVPKDFNLSQNYPNPFNPNTIINYQLPTSGFVKLNIYDVSGKLIKELVKEKQNAGSHSVNFSGEGLSSGIYYYCLITNGLVIDTKKAILLK